MSAVHSVYKGNKKVFYWLIAAQQVLQKHNIDEIKNQAVFLEETYEVDHINNRGMGGSGFKICDFNNMQLMLPMDNTLKGSKREDHRDQDTKDFIKQVLND